MRFGFMMEWHVMAALALMPLTARAADADAGQAVFKTQCAACHATQEGKNMIGPSLFGVAGRESGGVAGFRYSPANQNAHVVWTPEILDKYLISPKAVVPGTTMLYAGLKDDAKRADLIAYLATLK